MTGDDETERPLADLHLDSLRMQPVPHDLLEERSVRYLRGKGILGRRKPSWFRYWALRAMAASLCFGAGYGISEAQNGHLHNFRPDQRIAMAAQQYLNAIAEVPANDSLAQAVAVSTLRSATIQLFQRFPTDQLGLALTVALSNSTPNPPSIARREEGSQWY